MQNSIRIKEKYFDKEKKELMLLKIKQVKFNIYII